MRLRKLTVCMTHHSTMNIELKDLSEGPVYAQVREQIETQISSKAVASGETFPPRRAGAKLSVDKGEIQRAYFELEHSGSDQKGNRQRLPRPAKTTYRVA